MARLAGGGGLADFVFVEDTETGDIGTAPSGTVITFWDSLTAGNQYTGRPTPDDGTGLTDGAGNPIDSVTTDADGYLPASGFYFPDIAITGVTRMAADASSGAGPRRWMYPNDPLALAVQALAAVATQSAELTALNLSSPAFAYYNASTMSYPARPATGAPVWWVGPVAPTFGGTGAVDNLDYWMGPSS